MYMFLPNDEIKGTVKLEVRHDKLSDKKRYEAYSDERIKYGPELFITFDLNLVARRVSSSPAGTPISAV